MIPISQLGIEFLSQRPLVEFDIFRSIPTNSIVRTYEKAIEDASVIAKHARRLMQVPLTIFGNYGNKKVIIGQNGWLFYRPSFEHVTRLDFNPYRELGPFGAIVSFHQTLKEQGVELILVPIPGKSVIYPEYASKRYDLELGPPVNILVEDFMNEIKAQGIEIFDPTNILWEAKRSVKNDLLYLPQDTHWTPTGMKLVAFHLAKFLEKKDWIRNMPKRSYTVQRLEVKRTGDLYDMLDLPNGFGGYEPMTVTIERVIDKSTGKACKPDQGSPIVLLGDSFVNIYSAKDMGWGESAGFAEHLTLNLGIPLDVIAINDGGPTGSRQQLARRPNALLGKKLVIWEFPTRDITNPESRWEIIHIPKPKIVPKVSIPQKPREMIVEEETQDIVKPSEVEGPKEEKLVVIAEVVLASNVPDPSQVAYSDCLTYVKYRILSVEKGNYQDNELIAVFWGMRNSQLMPAAKFKPGERHKLTLEPLQEHPELSHYMQADDTNDYEREPFWVTDMTNL